MSKSFLHELTDLDVGDVSTLESVFADPLKSVSETRWERKSNKTPSRRTRTPGGSSRHKTPSGRTKTPTSRRSKTPTSRKTPGHKTPGNTGDRFIPNRSAMNRDVLNMASESASKPTCTGGETQERLKPILGQVEANQKVLAFKSKAPKPRDGYQNNLRVIYTANRTSQVTKKKTRHISSTPERILDAPDLTENFYLNLLDWSASNLLAVGLGNSVYLWNAASGTIDLLMETADEENFITSVQWMPGGSHIAIGVEDADLQLWDAHAKRQVRSLRGHSSRVSALAWNIHLLSSGSRDCTIYNHDVRIRDHHVHTLKHHEQEVCGLKWSPDGTQLASGGNDNMVCVWDASTAKIQQPKHVFQEHQAAVKALAWCPWQKNTLASGGGTADRHIRFYNTQTGACLNAVDTQSQVCSIIWNPFDKEIITGHGFSQNQLTVWKYPTMVRTHELTGHTSRVLHMSLSPDGTTVCSAAADETLRFWKVFEPVVKASKSKSSFSRPGKIGRMNIR